MISDDLKLLAVEYYKLCASFKLTHYIEQKLLSKAFFLGKEEAIMASKKQSTIKKHKEIKVQFEKISAMVDSGIADLILDCWKLGIHTLNSCEGQITGNAYIQFTSAIDAESFLNHTARYSRNKNSMYSRMRHSNDDNNYCNLKTEKWSYNIRDPKDLGLTEFFGKGHKINHKFNGTHDFSFALSIHFPVSDLSEVKKNIRSVVGARFGANLTKAFEDEGQGEDELMAFIKGQKNKLIG